MLLGLGLAALGAAVAIGIILIKLKCKKCNKKQLKEWQRNGTIKSAIKCVSKKGNTVTFEELEKSSGKTRRYEVTQDEQPKFFGKVKEGKIYNYC